MSVSYMNDSQKMKETKDSIERIKRIRNGEKVTCWKCKRGVMQSPGCRPQESNYFRCDECGNSVTLHVPLPKELFNK